KEEIAEKLASGIPYVIRQRIADGETTFHDEVFGDITVENTTLDDQVLIKADGMPTYNFANVVDDHEMGITHVVRGNEYLASSPKYNLLYEAFGWEIPKYIHCPPVMKDATNKLSKRNGDASYQDLVAKGYLTEAILNYILLLGWSPVGEQEFFTLDEMIKSFNIEGVSKSPAIFDVQKLKYINAEYLRRKTLDEFHELALPWIRKSVKSDVDTKFIASIIQPRCEVLEDIPDQLDFIDELPEYSDELYVSKKMKTNQETSLEVLKELLPIMQAHNDYSMDSLHEMLFAKIEEMGVKNGYILWPIRVAVSGKQFTPGGALEICTIIGKDETINRIQKGIEMLSK
ncbi:MAG: glutamate--tRNA ligase, partial [Oscillospiraceae bacterium]